MTKSVGSLIDEMSKLRDQRRALAKKDEELKEKYTGLEAALIEAMDKNDITKSTGKTAAASVSSTTSFNISDYDAFTAFVLKKKMCHLFQRRISSEAARELFEKGTPVPGLETFTKRGINLRNL